MSDLSTPIARLKHLVANAAGAQRILLDLIHRPSEHIAMLLSNLGTPGHCKGCGAPIWWIIHLNGKRVPYNLEGLNHFADCPNASTFRRKPGSSTIT